ncbi:chromosome segregation SMC family protein [Bacillus carboniphilus]|uniref:chromosome segregation SMC family protein n=1 Tax=Bacillus carboniphilus TaxID=86663 RepID=UPI003FCEE38C
MKVLFASKEQSYENKKELLDNEKKDILRQQERLDVLKEDLALLNNELTNQTSGESQIEKAAEQKFNDKNKTLTLITSRREERHTLFQQLEKEELEIKEVKRQYKKVSQLLKEDEVHLNRLDVELDNRLTQLREDYEMSFEAAKHKYPLLQDEEQTRKQVKLIKLEIEELGTVNLGAIDECERISERYNFLTEQKQDLTDAQDTLFQVINEMDTEMKKRFETTFTDIRSHFHVVFRQLFGGGRADLQLTDPEDLLNTGVQILAQPPGKKLQHLSLLSGGERALTAIALLFSILKVKPVPFCVLDEVEAALDEANVYRFAQYLKQYSEETQFIVITHRKGTMEEADVLYGVTMQESGVSKLVSVRLNEMEGLTKSS